MNRKTVVLIAVLCSIMMVHTHQRSARAYKLESWQSCCGAVCLRVVSQLLNHQRELSDIRVILQPKPTGEVSLNGIQKAAKAMGFNAVGCRMTGEMLTKCTLPMVAHWKPNHFVVLIGLGEGRGVSVVDPPRKSRLMTKEELTGQDYWNVVAVSNRPISTRGLAVADTDRELPPPRDHAVMIGNLQLDADIWHFGHITEGVRKTHRFSLKNIGQTPVFLETVKSNCPCLSIDRWTREIAPSQTGFVEVTIDSTDLQGHLGKSVLMSIREGQATEATTSSLWVAGLVVPQARLIVTPQVVDVGEIARADTVSRTIRIRRLGFEPVGLTGIRSDSASIRATRDDSSVPPGQDIEAQLHITAPALGSFEHTVTIQTDHQEHPCADILVRGTVVPATRAEPRELFLGVLTPRSARKCFTVRNTLDKPFLIKRAKTDCPGVACEIDGSKDRERAAWEMKLQVTDTLPSGLVNGNVILETTDGDAPTLRIPFTGWKP